MPRPKALLWALLVAAFALFLGWAIMVFLIDGLLQAPFAKGFVLLCRRALHLGFDEAVALYNLLFRDRKPIWMGIGLFALLLAVFYVILRHYFSRFNRHLSEVSTGIDKLVVESTEEITLSPELELIGEKLNAVKAMLERRVRDAQEAEQRKNDLVVYLAHDIKTPLTSVIGYLSLLDEAPDMPAEQKAKYVKITLDKAYRLEHLIDEFFEITRFNLQTIVLEEAEINLPYMLLQMADAFYPMLAPGGRKAVVDAEEGLTLWGDADKLARVFNNILKNAIAYSDENSTIAITARKQGDMVAITFANRGRTIPQSKLDTIFERFYRLDGARSSGTGGAGLGLAIAKEIVSAHGGSITAESSNSRTVFTVMLPGGKP